MLSVRRREILVLHVIWGWSTVFDRGGEVVTDRAVLGRLADFVDDDDLLATD